MVRNPNLGLGWSLGDRRLAVVKREQNSMPFAVFELMTPSLARAKNTGGAPQKTGLPLQLQTYVPCVPFPSNMSTPI
jgi:hypothetical protein